MSQIVSFKKEDGEQIYINVTGNTMFTGTTHLEIHLINENDDINNVKIWVEREDEHNAAKHYELCSGSTTSASYSFYLDGKEIPFYTGSISIDSNGVLTGKETVTAQLDPYPHVITLVMDGFKYGKLYKYGRLIQIKGQTVPNEEEDTEDVQNATRYWMENAALISSVLTYRIEPASTNWINISDSEGKAINVSANNTDTKRECDVIYNIDFGDFGSQEAIVLHIVQVANKNVELNIKVVNSEYQGSDEGLDKEIKKMLLPVEVYYLVSNIPYEVKWDTLMFFNTLSKTLIGEARYKWNTIDVSFEEISSTFGTVVGMDVNELKFKWLTGTTPSYSAGYSSEEYAVIDVKVVPINFQKRTAAYVTGYDEETGMITSWGYKDYYYVPDNKYTCAVTIFKKTLRESTDNKFLNTPDSTFMSDAKSVNVGEYASQNGNTVVYTPILTEYTIDSEYVDFDFEGLQTATGVYNAEYNILNTTGDLDHFTILGLPLKVSDDVGNLLLDVDDPADFKEPTDTYFYSPIGIRESIKISADFTSSTENTIKGLFTYYPMLVDIVHTAGYKCKYDSCIKEEDLSDVNHKQAFAYKLDIANPITKHFGYSRSELEDAGITIPPGYGNTWIETPHVAENGYVHYFIETAADGGTNEEKMFDLYLHCDLDLPHSVVWDGLSEGATIDPDPDPDDPEVYWLRVHLDSVSGVSRGEVWIENPDDPNDTSITECQVEEGTNVTIHAGLYHCCMPFIQWAESDRSATALTRNADYSFNMPARDYDLWASFEPCPCELTVTNEVYDTDDYTYTIDVPAEKSDTEYYFVINNTTDGVLTIKYTSFTGSGNTFEVPKGLIAEASMFYSAEWGQWVTRIKLTEK